ncbi:MAG: hypothetical protein EU548_09895 [Promethearchaeota archaeon]|nr:MAG: hypothetical protein EU548_09895 [Candidatus Lokiarchaeota archaeon]
MIQNKKYFIGIIKPIREDFISNPTEAENKIMSEHFEYLKKLLKKDELLLAGPAINKENPFGIIIIKASSLGHAKELLFNDPSVKAKIQKVIEFEPFHVSLLKKLKD